jgi:hypothetical protein
MGRQQTNFPCEASGAFVVRHCVTEIVDGKPQRVQRSYRLCERSDKCCSARNASQSECSRRDATSSPWPSTFAFDQTCIDSSQKLFTIFLQPVNLHDFLRG